MPMGPDMFYHMPKLNGLTVAGLAQQMEEEREQNIPPHWRVYFTVTSADEAVERAKQAGGNPIMEAMDVFDSGRMAMLLDPHGAMFAVWEPKNHIGSSIKGEPGALAWVELYTQDHQEAAQFYKAVLGVEAGSMPGEENMTLLKAGGQDVADIMTMTPKMGPMPPHWAVYFGIDDVDATAEKAKSLGGDTVAGPMDAPGVGRWVVLRDPQGAVFRLVKGA